MFPGDLQIEGEIKENESGERRLAFTSESRECSSAPVGGQPSHLCPSET